MVDSSSGLCLNANLLKESLRIELELLVMSDKGLDLILPLYLPGD